MIIEHRCVVPVAVERLWDFLLDVPAVSRCLPGVDEFQAAGADTYRGAIRVKVGPIAIRVEGTIRVGERDRARWRAAMTAEGRDPRIPGGVTAQLALHLTPRGEGGTELHVRTDAAVLGKLGEFGQPVIRRSADRIMQQFVENVVRALREVGQATGAGR